MAISQEGGEKVFHGEYRHNIDAKGRIIVPIKFRENLGTEFVITRGFENSLFVFPASEWSIFSEKLKSLPMTNKNSRALTRHFLSGACDCEVDKQGRILLPQHLVEFAQISKEVTVAGNGNKLEIWATENWTQYLDNLDTDEVTAGLDEVGIMI